MAEEQTLEQTPVSTEPVAAEPQVQQEEKAPETLEEKFARLEKELADRNAAYEKDRARFDKRLAHVVSKKNSYRDEVFALREAALKQQAPGREPTAADYGNDPVKFIEGRDAYKQQTTAHQQELQRLQSEREQHELAEAHAYLLDAIEGEFGSNRDAHEAILKAPVSTELVRYMAKVPEGAKMAHYFSQVPSDAVAIMNARPEDRAGMLFAVMQHVRNGSNAAAPAPRPQVTAPVAAPVSAPPPPSGRGGQPPRTSANAQTAEEYSRARKAEYDAFRFGKKR